MKLDLTGTKYKYESDQPFYWVGHPQAYNDEGAGKLLTDRRADVDIVAGIVDEDASYSYDEFALVKLDGDYYLLQTSGCSCPSPCETWGVEIGPATLAEIDSFIRGGHYKGYTLPKQREQDFLTMLELEAQRNAEAAR